MMRIGRRRAMRLLVLMTGGVVINVLIAWGCLIRFADLCDPLGNEEYDSEVLSDSSRWSGMETWLGWFPAEEERRFAFGASESIYFELATDESGDRAMYQPVGFTHCGGWPCSALWGGVCWDPDRKDWSSRRSWAFEFERANTGHDIGILPLKPLWPGFVLNSVLYAAILGFSLAAPAAMRRRFRVRRGCCAYCGYPVGGSPVCTECGRPVTQVKSLPTSGASSKA